MTKGNLWEGLAVLRERLELVEALVAKHPVLADATIYGSAHIENAAELWYFHAGSDHAGLFAKARLFICDTPEGNWRRVRDGCNWHWVGSVGGVLVTFHRMAQVPVPLPPPMPDSEPLVFASEAQASERIEADLERALSKL